MLGANLTTPEKAKAARQKKIQTNPAGLQGLIKQREIELSCDISTGQYQ